MNFLFTQSRSQATYGQGFPSGGLDRPGSHAPCEQNGRGKRKYKAQSYREIFRVAGQNKTSGESMFTQKT